jgi:predicted AAA+ superfamily ATPase
MVRNYIPRSLEKVLEKAVSEFPAIVLTGPRQSGKTTLLKKKFGHQHFSKGFPSKNPCGVCRSPG